MAQQHLSEGAKSEVLKLALSGTGPVPLRAFRSKEGKTSKKWGFVVQWGHTVLND